MYLKHTFQICIVSASSQYLGLFSNFTFLNSFMTTLPPKPPCMRAKSLQSCPILFVTPWTVVHQLLCPWDSPGKNTGGLSPLLQEIFPTQGSNPSLFHCLGSPRVPCPVPVTFACLIYNFFSFWHLKVKVLVVQLCLTVFDPMDCITCQAPLSVEFSRQEYWSGLPFPSSGDLPYPGIKPRSSVLQAGSLSSEPLGLGDSSFPWKVETGFQAAVLNFGIDTKCIQTCQVVQW